MRLTDDEIRALDLDILEKMQMAFLINDNLQIELLGRIIEKIDNNRILIYECTINRIKNGWHIIKNNNTIIKMDYYKRGIGSGIRKMWHESGFFFGYEIDLIPRQYFINNLI